MTSTAPAGSLSATDVRVLLAVSDKLTITLVSSSDGSPTVIPGSPQYVQVTIPILVPGASATLNVQTTVRNDATPVVGPANDIVVGPATCTFSPRRHGGDVIRHPRLRAQSRDGPPVADFDDDGDTDISVFRPSTGVWYTSSPPTAVTFGTSGDIPVPDDYDGDGNVDHAVFRDSTGVWYLNTSPPATPRFGQSGDIPVPANYDNDDEAADIAVFRPSNGVWYFQSPAHAIPFGQSGDIPVPGDYNGDGQDEMAVFRPSDGTWFLNGPPASSPKFGQNGDIPVPGDYDGDGDTDIAVFRPSTGCGTSKIPLRPSCSA